MPVKYSKVLFVLTDLFYSYYGISIIEIYDGYKFMNSRQCTGLIALFAPVSLCSNFKEGIPI